MQVLEIQGIQMRALLISMHLFLDLWNSVCLMFQELLSFILLPYHYFMESTAHFLIQESAVSC